MTEQQQLERTSTRVIDVALVVAVYAFATVVLIVPTWLLAIGVKTLGAAAGWWNSSDGEWGWTTSLGVGAYVVVLGVSTLAVQAITRVSGIPFLPCVVAGGALLVSGAVGACAWFISL